MEQALFIEGEARLFGMLFLPGPKLQKSMGFVIVHPFAEEKKSAHRTLVELSRELYRTGYPVLMFDLRGCGDSEGSFAGVRLDEWLADIDRAIKTLKLHTGLPKLGMIGLRFGAYLSGCYMERYPGISECIWMEPVNHPLEYLRKSLRHKLMKELCTDGAVASNRDLLIQDLRDNTSIDFDGYEVGSGLFHDLMQLQENQSPAGDIHGLIISISMSGKMTKAVQEVCALNPAMEHSTIKMELFWNKVDDVENDELIHKISSYVKEKYI
jgi:pimeloyl-ACP methyl ester carboxylesterase